MSNLDQNLVEDLSVTLFQSGKGFRNKNYVTEKRRQLGMFWGNLQVSFLIVNTFNLNLNTLFCVILRQLSASTDFCS